MKIYPVEWRLWWRLIRWRRNARRIVRSVIACNVHLHIFGNEFRRNADALENVHFRWVPVERILTHHENENVIVQILWIQTGESGRFQNEVEREAFNHLAVFEILYSDPFAVKTQNHLLCPNAGRLFHVQQASHSVCWIHHFILLRNSERGQVFDNKAWTVLHISLCSSVAST